MLHLLNATSSFRLWTGNPSDLHTFSPSLFTLKINNKKYLHILVSAFTHFVIPSFNLPIIQSHIHPATYFISHICSYHIFFLSCLHSFLHLYFFCLIFFHFFFKVSHSSVLCEMPTKNASQDHQTNKQTKPRLKQVFSVLVRINITLTSKMQCQ